MDSINYYESIKQKSISGSKTKSTKEVIRISKENFKRRMVTAMVIASVVTSGLALTGNMLKEKMDDLEVVNSYVEENRSIVSENTHPAQTPGNYWYDTDAMGFSISTQEDSEIDTLLYSVYSNMNYNKMDCMDEVMVSLSKYADEDSEFKEYTSFKDYLLKKDFVDENNNVSTSEYKQYMNEYIAAKVNMENVKGRTK